jgi:hypothetical protein
VLRATVLAAVALALVAGCAAPGYRVRLETRGLPPRERELLLGDLERTARGSGFETVVARQRSRRPVPVVTSSFVRPSSAEPRERISLDVFYFPSGEAVLVELENARGGGRAARAELDALGEECLQDMSARAGRERVSLERGPARAPSGE